MGNKMVLTRENSTALITAETLFFLCRTFKKKKKTKLLEQDI